MSDDIKGKSIVQLQSLDFYSRVHIKAVCPDKRRSLNVAVIQKKYLVIAVKLIVRIK